MAVEACRLDIQVAEVPAFMFFSVNKVFACLLRVIGDVLYKVFQIAFSVAELFGQ